MKVLLINGSPHEKGCTYTGLCEVEKTLNANGINTEIIWLGNGAVRDCIACGACRKLGKCVFDDDICNEIIEKANLKQTSLYRLAKKLDISPEKFIEHFIRYERMVKSGE